LAQQAVHVKSCQDPRKCGGVKKVGMAFALVEPHLQCSATEIDG
jgi:hypothetical protein